MYHFSVLFSIDSLSNKSSWNIHYSLAISTTSFSCLFLFLFRSYFSLLSISIEGKEALRNINKKMGLGFDDWDLEFYTKMFTEQLMRNPTDVECFDLGKNCLFWENSYSYSCWCLCVGVGACAISMLTPLSLFLDLPVSMSVYLFISLYTCQFGCPSVSLPVCLSVLMSACLSFCLFACLVAFV